ncbi:MAG: hypothetical protein ACP5HG_17640 [Anaerolineae bacterium]
MPIDYIVLEQGSLVYARGYGTLTEQDLIEHETALFEDARVKRGYRQLLDLRWVAQEQITPDTLLMKLSTVHARAKSKVQGARYAIVAHSSYWFTAAARYQCDGLKMTMIVFNDPTTACIWLGTDYGDLQRTQRIRLPVPAAQPSLASAASMP